MALSYSQGNSTNTVGNTFSLAFPGAAAAGDTLVCIIRIGGASGTPTISDSVNGSWSNVRVLDNTGVTGDTLITAWFSNSASGTPTITASWVTSFSIRAAILDYTGGITSFDQYGTSATGGGGTWSTAMVTTTQANEVLIASIEAGGGPPSYAGNQSGSNPTSWINRFDVATGKLHVDDVFVSAIGTYGETWTFTFDSVGTSILTLATAAPTGQVLEMANVY